MYVISLVNYLKQMTNNIKISRRDIVKGLLAVGLSSLVSPYIKVFANDDTIIKISNQNKVTLKNLNVKIFEDLSKMVTLQKHLDADTVADMYKVFISEPWGKEHIISLYNKLVQNFSNPNSQKIKLNDGEKWFTNHLLTTWYLGVYYHQERPTKRITYEFALQHQLINDIIPIPFIEAGGFNSWEEEPRSLKV